MLTFCPRDFESVESCFLHSLSIVASLDYRCTGCPTIILRKLRALRFFSFAVTYHFFTVKSDGCSDLPLAIFIRDAIR